MPCRHAATEPLHFGDELNSSRGKITVSRKGQNDIYNLKSVSIAVVSSIPFLRNLREMDVEVLYMADPSIAVVSSLLHEGRAK